VAAAIDSSSMARKLPGILPAYTYFCPCMYTHVITNNRASTTSPHEKFTIRIRLFLYYLYPERKNPLPLCVAYNVVKNVLSEYALGAMFRLTA
jgi:hypothetical protein